MEMNMTKGSPFKLILTFLIPVVLGNIFQQLYNMADSIIVGRSVGADALAAVGATGTIVFLIIGFTNGMTSGFAVVTAQHFGAHDDEGVRQSVCSSIVLSAITVAVMTTLSLSMMRWLLTVMNTPDDVFDMSYIYISTICAGMVFTILYNLTASLLRAVGNSKVPLYFLVTAAALNVVLDLVLILVFKMGVFGAAIATVISQGGSGVACLIYIMKSVPALSPTADDWKHWRRNVSKQLLIGIPMALQFSVTAIGTVVVQGALNTLGSKVIASYTASQKVEQLLTTVFLGIGVAMATYTGQNYGVRDYKRIGRGVHVGSIMTIIYGVLIAVIMMTTTDYTIPLFVTGDATDILEYAHVYFSICPLFYVPLGLIFVFRNALQGMGYSTTTLLGALIELVSRIVLAIFAVRNASYAGVCYANAIAWLSAGILLFICYLIIIGRRKHEAIAA